MTARKFMLFTAGLSAVAAFLAGCGKDAEPRPATQVAAKVNGDEITVHEINDVLSRYPADIPGDQVNAKREVLDRLIDQRLAKQLAIEKKLDRSPKVMLAMEAAKNEVLARAYQEHIAEGATAPAPIDIHVYYKSHPELFAERKIFSLEELAFTADSTNATALRAQLTAPHSMQEAIAWLQARNIKFTVNHAIRSAEQLPLDKLAALQAMREGDIRLFDSGLGRLQFIQVVAYKSMPMNEAEAGPRIGQFLGNQVARETIAREMKKEKARAKIEYTGEFAGAIDPASNRDVGTQGSSKP